MLRAARNLVANPFTQSESTWRQAVDTLRGLSLRELGRVLRQRRTDRDRLVLAWGLVRTLDDETALTSRSLRGVSLPHSIASYRRVVSAGARCYHALRSFHGSSALAQNLRGQTWAACFGDSLDHAIDLDRVIRDHDVVVLGETGTGKERIAEAIQLATFGPEDGSVAPHSAVNAAAIPETLIASELFGHVRGAFTGATGTRIGQIRSADGGCFFLDEVGDLPATTQVKLLRVIETNEVQPLGSDRRHHVDVRYVAATQADLDKVVANRGFRADLFQRLAGIVIRIPPLRDRTEDIVDIGRAFVDRYFSSGDRPKAVDRWITQAAELPYSWPGNVRELQNALRTLLLGLDPVLGAPQPKLQRGRSKLPDPIARASASMRDVERWYLGRVLKRTGGNYSEAARILERTRATVRRNAKRFML